MVSIMVIIDPVDLQDVFTNLLVVRHTGYRWPLLASTFTDLTKMASERGIFELELAVIDCVLCYVNM